MRKNYPNAIRQFILRHCGLNARTLTSKINDSKLAKRLGVNYSVKNITTVLGNITRGSFYRTK